jgi:signal transduction histidine kinase
VPVKRLKAMRATAAFVAAGMLILLAMVALSYWLLERTRASTAEVLATREARSALVDLLSVVQDAETGQRGYLLSGEDRYLAPYDKAVKLTDERFAKLEQFFRRERGSEAFVTELRAAVDRKLAELAKTVELKKAGGADEAMALFRSDVGKDTMDHIRDLIGNRRDQVEARLSLAIADQRENATTLQWSIIGGGILIVLAGGGAAWTLSAYTREVIKARAEVEALNEGLELRVRERTADLQRANDEIQRFAYIVSHDLRAPLVNVMGFTSEMKTSLEALQTLVNDPAVENSPAAPAARSAVVADIPEALGFIQASTKKMDQLINAILQLSREGRRAINPEAVNLGALLEGISASVQHQLQNADGELIVENPLPTIISDRLALEQVFGNLVDNAIKYQAKGRPPKIEVRSRPERDGSVLIEIEDNGRGIAEHDHDRVFDLFRRAGVQDKQGEGIGLAHVRALVRRLGGQITLTSELGTGTTFRVRLPRNLRATLE